MSSAHRRPLCAVEASALAQERCVHRDLAEIVQAPGPAEPIDLREREPERAGEAVDIARNPQRVAIGRRVSLVDDVGERLERAQGLSLKALQPHL